MRLFGERSGKLPLRLGALLFCGLMLGSALWLDHSQIESDTSRRVHVATQQVLLQLLSVSNAEVGRPLALAVCARVFSHPLFQSEHLVWGAFCDAAKEANPPMRLETELSDLVALYKGMDPGPIGLFFGARRALLFAGLLFLLFALLPLGSQGAAWSPPTPADATIKANGDAENRDAEDGDAENGDADRRGDGDKRDAENSDADRRGDGDKRERLYRERLEDLYALRRRAWEVDRFAAYGELAAGLSHGLKSPLAGVKAAAQLAELKLGPDHAVAPQIADILGETDRLLGEIAQFLQATKGGEPVPIPVAPTTLMEAVAEGYQKQALRRGLIFTKEFDDSLPEIEVDPALFEMALRNIVENALDASVPGDALVLRTGRAQAPARVGLDETPPTRDEWIELVIEDQAGGIPGDVLEGQGPTTHKSGGSGLGLALARRIVARHGGALLVDVDSGRGSAVRFVLPARSAPASGSASESPPLAGAELDTAQLSTEEGTGTKAGSVVDE